MRRLLCGLLAAGFLAFVGLQAAHCHGSEARASESCCVCALSSQSVRTAPDAAPALAGSSGWAPVAPEAAACPLFAAPRTASARAPPSLA